MTLHALISEAAQATPKAVAVVGPDATVTYGELDDLAARAAAVLTDLGVGPGQRVGLYAPKSIRALAFMQGVLRVGAAYVPIDPASPARRAAGALRRCEVSAVATADVGNPLVPLLAPRVKHVALDAQSADGSWHETSAHRRFAAPAIADDALAFILCTSGSTGASKPVCISHRAAMAFVDWAVQRLKTTAEDRFANHAPLSFDLSVLDLYGAWRSGGRVILVPEHASYLGAALVDICSVHAVSVWYSVPSALELMLGTGTFTAEALPSLRRIIFAGEVFPIKGVRALRASFPGARLFNFYGPTETNVCTAHEVDEVLMDTVTALPLGSASCGNRVWAITDAGLPAVVGDEGELLVSGPTVAQGYWGGPRFVPGEPYHTGDWVRVLEGGTFEFIGRRDRLVKLRGHRVDLGEVERTLLQHPAIAAAATILTGEGLEARLVAYLVIADGATPPTLLAVKRFCATWIPAYMSVSAIRFVPALPRTSNGKVDYAALAAYEQRRADERSAVPRQTIENWA